MQKNNIVIIGIIALILFLPSSAKTEVQATWLDNIDKYELLSNEGLVVFNANESEIQNQPEKVDEVKSCECNGTKQIRTGDNRVLPCPCKDCKCSPKINLNLNSGDAPPIQEDTQKKNTVDTVQEETDYIPLLDGRCILFTNPEWCVPCSQLENTTLKELKKAGYKFGKVTDKKIHIIILDENSPMSEKYAKGAIPTFLFIKGGKIVKVLTGYQTSAVISKEINEVLK